MNKEQAVYLARLGAKLLMVVLLVWLVWHTFEEPFQSSEYKPLCEKHSELLGGIKNGSLCLFQGPTLKNKSGVLVFNQS
jgi:peptidoglycan/LPS O-acetylase OafA/YrhL